MRAVEFLPEETFIPAKEAGISGLKVFHGTSSANLSKIMRNGLEPRVNKWIHNNPYQHSVTKFAPGERKAASELSTTKDLERAISYAGQGGSTGWGDKTGGVVVSFVLADTDMVSEIGYDETEIVIKNKISPNRLTIVYPDRLIGKEQDYLEKADKSRSSAAIKNEKIKKINKSLKDAGSFSSIKSLNPRTPRIAVVGPAKSFLGFKNLDLDTTEFNAWLQNELKTPTTPADEEEYWNKKLGRH